MLKTRSGEVASECPGSALSELSVSLIELQKCVLSDLRALTSVMCALERVRAGAVSAESALLVGEMSRLLNESAGTALVGESHRAIALQRLSALARSDSTRVPSIHRPEEVPLPAPAVA